MHWPFQLVSRRRWLCCAGAVGAAALMDRPGWGWQAANVIKRTFVYKTAGSLDIKVDVHRADDDKIRPLAVWIHGGALINGHRGGISGRVLRGLLKRGYAVASIDYRLAPETKLPSIIDDVEDAFRWIRAEGREKFRAAVDRIAVLGGSAGGYLTLTAGFRVQPRPTVLCAFWGYGDLVGSWYSEPSPHARHQRVKLSRAEALAQVDGAPVSDSRDRKGNGGAFYQHCRQHGTWPKSVSGWDPRREVEKYVPYMPVRNVDAQYPPTILIHGTDDTDVPFEQSKMMAQQFKQHNVKHRLIAIEGGEHGLGGGKPEEIEQAYQQAFQFIEQHMQ